MTIKRVVVVKECEMCEGADFGCIDCNGNYKGEITEEIDFEEFMFELIKLMQQYRYIKG